MSSMLTGCNSKKLLPQSNVNKEHVFFKKKKIYLLVFHYTERANVIFSGHLKCNQKSGASR